MNLSIPCLYRGATGNGTSIPCTNRGGTGDGPCIPVHKRMHCSEPGILCSYKGGTGVDPSTCIPCSLRGGIGDGYSILRSEKNGTEDGLQYPRFREEVTLERDSCAEV